MPESNPRHYLNNRQSKSSLTQIGKSTIDSKMRNPHQATTRLCARTFSSLPRMTSEEGRSADSPPFFVKFDDLDWVLSKHLPMGVHQRGMNALLTFSLKSSFKLVFNSSSSSSSS